MANARHTYRIYPTSAQAQHLARTFGCVRYVYNWALAMRSVGWKEGKRINYFATSAELTELKKTSEAQWLNEVSSVPVQQALRDLQRAFVNFFEKRAGYPVFKRKDSKQSAGYTVSGFTFDPATRVLKFAKIGAIKVKWSRGGILPAPTSARIIRDAAGRYFVSFVVDIPARVIPNTGESVGIDFGLNRLATLSNGERVANPRYLAKRLKRLAFLQREMDRKTKGSNRRFKAKRRVAKLHGKIADTRRDNAHKLTTNLVKRFDVICIEDLNLRGMVKNQSLSRSVSDAGIGQIARMLECKAAAAGKLVVKIDRFFPSSKTCSHCGHVNAAVILGVGEWECPKCNTQHDRDDNAAKNILAVGQTVAAHGGSVRPARATVRAGKTRRSVNRLESCSHGE